MGIVMIFAKSQKRENIGTIFSLFLCFLQYYVIGYSFFKFYNLGYFSIIFFPFRSYLNGVLICIIFKIDSSGSLV